MFSLYVGIGVMYHFLGEGYFQNFGHLVVAARGVIRHVPSNDDRKIMLKYVGRNADKCFRHFIKKSY